MRIWGFSGPLGAFICAWGGVAMLASAPFDDWWHNAYGLDVKIISPPHMVLAAGFFGINFGTVMLMLAFLNRASSALARPALQRMFLYVGGMAVCESLLLKLEYISRSRDAQRAFYPSSCSARSAIIAALGVASRHRWGCTILTARLHVSAWLSLAPAAVSAQPKLGPVYHPVTHFIPWEFPLLLIVPAFVMDLILQRTAGVASAAAWPRRRRGLLRGGVPRGAVAVCRFHDVAAARNWFFGGDYMDYGTPPTSPLRASSSSREPTPEWFWRRMAIAALLACLMASARHASRSRHAEGPPVRTRNRARCSAVLATVLQWPARVRMSAARMSSSRPTPVHTECSSRSGRRTRFPASPMSKS